MTSYKKARLHNIPAEMERRGWSSRYNSTSKDNIKQLLIKAGYSEKAIAKLKKEGRIFIEAGYLSTTLKPGQKLYVLDIPEDHNLEDHIDRFCDLELD